ncbi:unnamed protein product, partial [Trichobilharzia regenti]
PDDILRVNCSSEFAGRTTDWSLSGYLRRIRLTWNFINEETEAMHNNSNSSMEKNINLLNTSSSFTSSPASTSLITRDDDDDDVNSTLLLSENIMHQPIHYQVRQTSGIQFLVRISSQMLFVGNFSVERSML